MADRGEDAVNYYDLKPIEWHHACRKIYKDCVRGDGNRYAVIDAEQSFEQVQAQLIPHLMKIDAHLRKRPVTAEA
ncbi:thymidylate kinase [compost metagenome]